MSAAVVTAMEKDAHVPRDQWAFPFPSFITIGMSFFMRAASEPVAWSSAKPRLQIIL